MSTGDAMRGFVVLLVSVGALGVLGSAGAAANALPDTGQGRIVFASYLPAYPLPDNFQVDRTYTVGIKGGRARELELGAVLSPDSSRYAVARTASALWVVRMDGTHARQVASASGGTTISDVAWSPDGTRLTFVAGGLWIVDADGTNLHELFTPDASTPAGTTISNVAWSPDRTRLTFVAGGIWIVDADGTNLRELFAPDGLTVSGVAWSPDDSRAAVFAGSQIWLIAADGSAPQRLFSPTTYSGGYPLEQAVNVAWAPTGSAFAVTVEPSAICLAAPWDACLGWYVLTFDRAGAPIGKLAAARDVSWSQNGKRLAFETGPFLIAPDEVSIDTALPDGTKERRVGPPPLDGSHCLGGPRWLNATTLTYYMMSGCDQDPDIYAPEVGFTVVRDDLSGSLGWQQRASDEWFSPDGTRVAFLDRYRHTTALYTANRNGTNKRRLTAPSVHVSSSSDSGSYVMWSGDGRRLAFTTSNRRVRDLDLVSPAGGPVRRIARVSSGSTLDPIWVTKSGVGYRSQLLLSDVTALWTMRADGTDIRRLTSDVSSDTDPAWSPDRRLIAFARDTTGGSSDSPTSIEIVPAGGGRVRRVVGAPRQNDSDPSWAPDGKKLAYLRNGSSIYIVNADGTRAHRLPTPRSLRPTGLSGAPWSPDGKTIAYASSVVSDRIVLVRADGSRSTTVLRSCRSCLGPPAWSHDGTRLAFECMGCVENETGIAVMNADGSDLRLIAPDEGLQGGDYPGVFSHRSPAWSPDGRRLLFAGTSCTSDPDPVSGPPAICSIALDGTGLHALTPDNVGSYGPSWTK